MAALAHCKASTQTLIGKRLLPELVHASERTFSHICQEIYVRSKLRLYVSIVLSLGSISVDENIKSPSDRFEHYARNMQWDHQAASRSLTARSDIQIRTTRKYDQIL